MPVDPFNFYWWVGRDMYYPLCPTDDELYHPFRGAWRDGLNPYSYKADYETPAQLVRAFSLYTQLKNEGWPVDTKEYWPTADLDDANAMLPGISAFWEPLPAPTVYGNTGVDGWADQTNFDARMDLSLYPLTTILQGGVGRSHSRNFLLPDFPSPYDFNTALESLYARTYHRVKCCQQARRLMHGAGWREPAY